MRRRSGIGREVEGGPDDELPTSRDGCREPHAIKAKRYETLRGSSSTVETYIAFRRSQGSIVLFAVDNELASFNTTVRYLQTTPSVSPVHRNYMAHRIKLINRIYLKY